MRHIKTYENFKEEELLEEGWKENIMAVVIATAGLFSSAKSQNSYSSKPEIQNLLTSFLIKKADSIPFGKIFNSGKYSINTVNDDEVRIALEKLGSFIEAHKNDKMSITIQSSESRVPNRDGEKPGNPKLEEGELAKKRAETAQQILNLFLQKIKNENVKITNPEILIGDVAWPSIDPKTKKQRTKDDKVYTDDQFVNILVKVKESEPIKITPFFKIKSKMDEPMYIPYKLSNGLYAEVDFLSRSSESIEKGGGVNTQYVDVLFKTLTTRAEVDRREKLDKAFPNPSGYQSYYFVPSSWWNKYGSGTNRITRDLVDKIENAGDSNVVQDISDIKDYNKIYKIVNEPKLSTK